MKPREFAKQVARQLQDAHYEALWAGGCVRDELVGREPKDYDVATNATPDEVRQVFGRRRTIAIGAAFGVITVIGPKSAGNIEVATFRRDADYSDGRRPDSVEFTDAREDAFRRDFTINGMFFDPVRQEVIDYVGGQDDLKVRVVRAIGDPHARIAEDKLRMLRGVRFATTFDFELEAETFAAIQKHAPEITIVSPERIGAEMRRILAHPNRHVGADLLRLTGLWSQILPGAETLYADETRWNRTLESLQTLGIADFETGAAVCLDAIVREQSAASVFAAWKLSNAERKAIEWIIEQESTLSHAHSYPWSVIQPLLVNPHARQAIDAIEAWHGGPSDATEFCRSRLTWSHDRLDPPPLLTGDDLIAAGYRPGKQFAAVLQGIRVAQLDNEVSDKEQAMEIARSQLINRSDVDRG